MKINWLWDTTLSEARVKKILHNEKDPRFFIYAEKLFSRVTEPKEAFHYVSKESFQRKWPVIRKRIEKDTWAKAKSNFWQGVYEQSESLHNIPQQRLTIAQRIKELRIKKGYTQVEMAKRLGVIQQYVSRLESGHENLTLDTLQKIAQVFSMNLTIQLNNITAGY